MHHRHSYDRAAGNVMEISGEALSATAPTLHSLDEGREQQKHTDSREEGEKQPLLEGKCDEEKKKQLLINLGRFSQWNWKNIITVTILWLTYLAASIAYSIIGPFFPDEVSEFGWLLKVNFRQTSDVSLRLLPSYSLRYRIDILVHAQNYWLLEFLQAAEKGSTSFLTGIIISCSPLCVVILSPLIGYYVSASVLM